MYFQLTKSMHATVRDAKNTSDFRGRIVSGMLSLCKMLQLEVHLVFQRSPQLGDKTMTPEEVLRKINISSRPRLKYGKLLYELLTENHLIRGLEVKPDPSLSTLYLAAAVSENQGGTLTSVWHTPLRPSYDVVQALSDADLSTFVSIYEEPSSYNWRLMKLLKDGHFESYDFCVIEAGMSWYSVGFACCLMERLLKPGGWIVIDNLRFNYKDSHMFNRKWISTKPEEELTACQASLAFELLIQSSPFFQNHRIHDSVGFAQKTQAVWSQEAMIKSSREVIVGKAVDRARVDADYRDSLLRNSFQSPFPSLCPISLKKPDRFSFSTVIGKPQSLQKSMNKVSPPSI